jgi:hypothetical protein
VPFRPLIEPALQLPDGLGGDFGSVRAICAGRPALKEIVAKLMLENRLLGQERSRSVSNALRMARARVGS